MSGHATGTTFAAQTRTHPEGAPPQGAPRHFASFFQALWGNAPFAWQDALAKRVLGGAFPANHAPADHWPDALRLFDGDWFECSIALETRERPPTNLDPQTWTRESRVWASVTPVVLNRHFDGDDRWEESAESVKAMCEHIGLPRPREVLLHPVSRIEGVPHAREFPQLVRKRDGGRRRHHHAVVIFDRPVCGPVLIGAGRFRGYGMCRPLDDYDAGGRGER